MSQSLHRILAVLTLWMLCTQAPARAGEIAVIVHPHNPVAAMSAREVSDLYLGRSRSFAVDDQKLPAAVYEQPQDSALRESFFRSLNGMSLKQLNAYWARLRFSGEVLPPMALPDSRLVLEAVGRNRGGIGYVDAALADGTVKVVLRLKD
jgi:ABC-type phosphate transport system substrate-binding protein